MISEAFRSSNIELRRGGCGCWWGVENYSKKKRNFTVFEFLEHFRWWFDEFFLFVNVKDRSFVHVKSYIYHQPSQLNICLLIVCAVLSNYTHKWKRNFTTIHHLSQNFEISNFTCQFRSSITFGVLLSLFLLPISTACVRRRNLYSNEIRNDRKRM